MNKNIKKQILNEIEMKNVKVVSFDLFDTLLIRPVLKPTDLFYIVEKRANESINEFHFSFLKVRQLAEKIARNDIAKSPEVEEVSIDDIYHVMGQITRLDANCLDKLKKIEIEVEIQYIRKNETIFEIYEHVLSLDKEIVLISDFYINDGFINRVLEQQGITGFKKVYVSSEIGKTKETGSMFKHVLADQKIDGSKFLHIGDNENADYAQAKKFGILSFLVQKNSALFFSSLDRQRIWTPHIDLLELPMRIMLGFLANKLARTASNSDSDSLFLDSTYLLGYYGIGSLLFSLTKWIMDEARREEIDQVGFAARDGYLSYHAYRMLRGHIPSTPSAKYFESSRGLSFPSQYRGYGDLCGLIDDIGVDNTAPAIDFLTNRFFLEDTEKLRRHFLKSEIELDKPISNYDKFIECFLRFRGDAFTGLERQFELGAAYYNEVFKETKKIAVFDIGYTARVQRSLRNYLEKSIVGFYFFTFSKGLLQKEESENIKNYYSSAFNQHLEIPPILTELLEVLFSDPESGTAYSFEEDGTRLTVKKAPPELDSKGIEKVKDIQKGALEFCKELTELFGSDVRYLEVSPKIAGRVMSHFSNSPSYRDAKLLDGLKFSNQVTGKTGQPFIGETLNESIWKNGYLSISTKGKYFETGKTLFARIGWRVIFVPFVRPFIKGIGSAEDIIKFDDDPSYFFASLNEAHFRAIGALFFPANK